MEKDELAVSFGQIVRFKRKEMGLSQDNLALLSGLDRSYLGRIERGEVNVTLKVIYQIARVIKCLPNELLPSD